MHIDNRIIEITKNYNYTRKLSLQTLHTRCKDRFSHLYTTFFVIQIFEISRFIVLRILNTFTYLK